jgi:membrane fusion protein
MEADQQSLDKVAGGFAGPVPASTLEPLFRPEALAAAAQNGIGQPAQAYPLSWRLLSAALLAMTAATAVLLMLGSYSRKETARGVVRSVSGEVRVSAPLPGVITQMRVGEQQVVRAGQVLLAIGTRRIGADGRPNDLETVASLDAEIGSLSARIVALDASADLIRSGNRARLSGLGGELQALAGIETALKQRLALAEQALARAEPVAQKGFISGEVMRRRRDEIASLHQALAEAAGRRAGLQGPVEEMRAALSNAPYTLLQEKGRLLDQLERARRERQALFAQRGYLVTAPTDGVVTALQVAPGQLVDPQRILMTITKPGAAVTAELYVPSRAIGFLRAGQPVRVRYDAFPFERYGTATGKVQAVSATVLLPQEVQAAVEVREPMYRVLVALDRAYVDAYGARHEIKPGVALTADIILDKRSFASWLLDPLLALKGRL